jgi:hypothetical protein
MALLLFGMMKNWGWIGLVPVFLAVSSVLVGVFGGIGLAMSRSNRWWLLITLASFAIGFFGLQGAMAIRDKTLEEQRTA